MANPIQLPRVRRRWHGPQLWKVISLVVVVAAVSVALLYYGHGLWFKKPAKKVASGTGQTVDRAAFLRESSNGDTPGLPLDKDALRREEELRKALDASRKANEALLAKLESMNGHDKKTDGKKPEGEKAKPKRERAKAVYVVNEQKAPAMPAVPLYTLAVWEYIPCVLENVLNSEIPGSFTVKITRPVLDATRQQVLIPQGQRVGATAETANLLFGNERIPTFALSVSLPNGQALDLGHAPIMDAAGTNGLTGDVDNHVWRLVWTSVFIGGLRGGQQVLQKELDQNGAGAIAAGISREGSSVMQQRLGRAQDTRPTITVKSGEVCNILVPEAKQLPSFAAASR